MRARINVINIELPLNFDLMAIVITLGTTGQRSLKSESISDALLGLATFLHSFFLGRSILLHHIFGDA